MNKLLIGFLALISLFFSSCQEEDFDIKDQNLNYKVEQKSFKELMSETAFKTSVNKLSKGKTSKNGTLSKSEIEEQYNFTIYEELPVNVTETEKVMAYNIAIKSDSLTNENSFENLVINTDKVTNETEIHIVKHNLLSEITTSEHGTPDFESTIEITTIVTNKNGTCCVNLPVRMCSYQHEHVAGPNCQNENYLFMVTLTACRECGNAGGNTDVSGTAGTSTTNTTSTSTGGGNNPIIISTPVVPVKPTPEQIVSSFVALQLNQEQQQWWNNNKDSAIGINLSVFIVKNYPMTNENREFVKQMIDYCKLNPNITWEQIKRWFLAPVEGQDFKFDPNYWNNPNLTFPAQNLPTKQAFKDALPKFANGEPMTGADNVYALAGGNVYQVRLNDDKHLTDNTCALKISIALNRCGVIIPNIPGETIEGGGEFAGKYFFLNARALNIWMQKTFGINHSKHIRLLPADGGLNGINYPSLPQLQNVYGIYSMITQINPTTNTPYEPMWGHADYFYTNVNNLADCRFGCYWNRKIEHIDIWILD